MLSFTGHYNGLASQYKIIPISCIKIPAYAGMTKFFKKYYPLKAFQPCAFISCETLDFEIMLQPALFSVM